jgi:hypothetical protein
METIEFKKLKTEIQFGAKKGIDFILAAAIVWLAISYIWSFDDTSYNRSIFTFIIGAFMLPLALGLSKIIKTKWTAKGNPLQPLGLWLNFAQLVYFPFLFFILNKDPDYFIMTYVIITGAHLFSYAWFYDEIGYAIWAVIISVGAFLLAQTIKVDKMWIVPLFASVMLFLLAGWILMGIKKLKVYNVGQK